MNDLFSNLGGHLKGSSSGTKSVAVLVGIALIAVITVAAVVSSRPDFQLAFSGLSDHEFPKVTRALADGGVSFRTSQPPAPFSVYVDDSDRSAAYRAVYGAGALEKPLRGILSDSGVAGVFSSAEERRQAVRKREWGEMEKMLEALDFVISARVRTAPTKDSPLPSRKVRPMTASVTLRVVDNAELTRSQKETVANLVSRGLGVSKENLVVSDQTGRNLFDGSFAGEEDFHIKDLLTHQGEYDARLTEIANVVLHDVLGPRKARVTVSSEWDYAQSTTHTEQAMGEGAMIREEKSKTDRTIPSGVGEAVGVSANTINPAGTNTVLPSAGGGEPMKENTSDETREYVPTIAREDRVDYVPDLERLSVALFLDQSLEGEEVELEKLEEAIKASVGFTEGRDEFRSVIFPFAGNATPEAVGDAVPEEVPSEPSPLVDKLLERGLEILTGLVFLTLLLRSLRKSNPPKPAPVASPKQPGGSEPTVGPDSTEPEIDPETLARLKVEELLNSDPAKVSEVLSQWVHEDEKTEAPW